MIRERDKAAGKKKHWNRKEYYATIQNNFREG